MDNHWETSPICAVKNVIFGHQPQFAAKIVDQNCYIFHGNPGDPSPIKKPGRRHLQGTVHLREKNTWHFEPFDDTDCDNFRKNFTKYRKLLKRKFSTSSSNVVSLKTHSGTWNVRQDRALALEGSRWSYRRLGDGGAGEMCWWRGGGKTVWRFDGARRHARVVAVEMFLLAKLTRKLLLQFLHTHTPGAHA